MSPPRRLAPSFDRLARPYRWLEYLTFGRALERSRNRFIAALLHHRSALVLGDGDGRFLAHLLQQNPHLTVTTIDASGAMLQLLEHRCRQHRDRLTLHHRDALDQLSSFPAVQLFDLVVTHFFLDCLSQPELDRLVACIGPHTRPGALWVVSEFHIPSGWRSLPARLLVRSLYGIFGLLTGLAVRRLPDHPSALARAGFRCVDRHRSIGNLLTSELWQKQP